MKPVSIPGNYDYVGVYLTDKCHLSCDYCITRHHNSDFGKTSAVLLDADSWIAGLNRLVLPEGIPLTLQGGEPFLYKGIWEILNNLEHKVDILTALPPFLEKKHFQQLKTLNWNKREAPYPTIRVSYHKGQNDYERLIERIADLQDMLSIGLFYLEHPGHSVSEIEALREYAAKYGVELRTKEFLGKWQGKQYGNLLYKDAAKGSPLGIFVKCRNTVVPIGPDGTIHRCHSNLYFNRKDSAIGNITADELVFPDTHLDCKHYGLCNECDVKVKTNHLQIFGYTSVDIEFCDGKDRRCLIKN
ncbi:MAG: radical SAM protein [bacterium]|nr:radical SAM protein [bacterium]